MHIAFLSSLLPSANPTTGFEIANACVVEGLRTIGHRVSTFGLLLPRQPEPPEDDAHVLGRRDLENTNAGRLTKLRWLATAIASGLPFAAAKLRGVEGFSAFNPSPYDAVVLNSWQVRAAYPLIAERCPTIYLSHNVEWKSAAENARHVRSGFERLLHARDARLLRRLEGRFVGDADFVWTLCEDDARTFDVGDDRHAVLPLVLPGVGPRADASAVAFDAALIGTWSWQPNAVGLNWFLDRVLPHLPADIRVAIGGTTPDTLVREDPRLRWLGRVDDADALLSQAHVVPLVARGGTGVQLKTIEVCQRGFPAVATSSSLRGIVGTPDNVERADEPLEFARRLCEIVSKGRRGERLRADGAAFTASQTSRLHAALAAGVNRVVRND